MSTTESEIEMTEHTYTREDMARAWSDGYEDGIRYVDTCQFTLVPVQEPSNPYEQEDA